LKKVKEENTKNILPKKVLKVVTESKEEYVRPPPPGHGFHHPPPPGHEFHRPPHCHGHRPPPPPGHEFHHPPPPGHGFHRPFPPGHRFHHPPPPFKVNYERTISTYNDGTVEFGEWKIVSNKLINKHY